MNVKIKKQHIFFSSLLIFSLLSCKPEQPSTDFNVLIDVPSGEDRKLETKEDEDLIVEYNVEPFSESIDLKLLISKKPKNGKLKSCEHTSPFSISCVYSPNENFSGIDEIEFVTRDGDLKGASASKIMIEVIGTPDTPIALDGSFKADSAKSVSFQFPKAVDPDSSDKMLRYEIVSTAFHGEVSQCKHNKCTYKAKTLYEGSDLITYRVIDQTNLTSNTATMKIAVTSKKNEAIETFTQGVNSLKGVDIVWVIDNSGSMKDEQEDLARNFESFIENFMDNGKAKFPFNMGVITTDKYLSNSNNLLEVNSFGVPYNLTSSRAETDFMSFKADFEKVVNVGIRGSGTEKCFESIEKLNVKNVDWFAGNDNLLVYIILTDEDEQSSGSASSWSKYFLGLKNEAFKTKVFPIVSLTNDSGNRFKTISESTGTKLYDIESSFNQVLDDISLNVSQNLSIFKLKQNVKIIESSIKVTVDGVAIKQFEFNKNSIKLKEAPKAYSTIVVKYNYGGY